MTALSEEQILAINAIRGILIASGIQTNSDFSHMDFNNLNELELVEIEAQLFNYVCVGIRLCDLNLIQLAIKVGCDLSRHPKYIDELCDTIFKNRTIIELLMKILFLSLLSCSRRLCHN